MPRLSKIGAAALGAFGWTGLSSVTASYLIVAGGGASSNVDRSGGAGAGGYVTGTTSLTTTLSYTVIVGAGGAASYNLAVNGSNSTFSSVVTAAVGGGAGSIDSVLNGFSGGSGGGGGGDSGGTGGTATSGQGNIGGTGSNTHTNSGVAGGGGGGSGAGSSPGNGGAGYTAIAALGGGTYAGGGGGGTFSGTPGTGGSGGGGAGGNSSAKGTPGTANTGGGAGGGGSGGSVAGSNGGSGVVIISYLGAQQFGGGVVTSSGGYTIHTFNTSGTLAPLSSLTAKFLVVAGGAGGGRGNTSNCYSGGGGGAGGLRSSVTATGGGGSLESALTIDTNSTYLVTVGAGGAAAASANTAGSSGTNSLFLSVTSTGGGYGGAGYNGGAGANGGSGGSGGGAGNTSTIPYPSGTVGSGTANQGFNGGSAAASADNGGGGGGGAGAVGNNATSLVGGNGGAGVSVSITGSSVTYAGGGGGAGATGGTGGSGGGGNGGATSTSGTSGTINTGSGGGGGANNSSTAGDGGSGIVIISYANATQQMAGGTVTISGGNVIHTFTSSGYLTPLKLVNNSLRFRNSASAYLNRTFGTPTNRNKWTWSGWVKRGLLSSSADYALFTDSDGSSSNTGMILYTNDTLRFYNRAGGVTNIDLTTTAVFRDPAAWYHVVLAYDSSQTTQANRVLLYVNGVNYTWTGTAASLNETSQINTNTYSHQIGSVSWSSKYFDGYLTEVNFIDGTALTPNSFGTFNSYGVWQPITYGGSYGTNGFYLPFTGTSSYNATFNGTSQYLVTTNSYSLSGNFTFEGWFYITSGSGPTVRNGIADAFTATGFVVYSGGFFTNNAVAIAWTQPTNSWNHFAVVRSGSTITLYLNGVSQGTVTNTSTFSGTLSIGANVYNSTILYSSTTLYESNIRLTNTAVYTSNFTPSTTPLTAVSGTQLLTLQNSTIIDNSGNSYILTNNGSVTTTQTYPFTMIGGQSKDYSPQGNNWTNNNIGVLSGSTLDVMTDVPTLTSATAANYATLNPLDYINNNTSSLTLTNGNLLATRSTTSYGGYPATMALPTSTAGGGKFVFEFTSNNLINGSTNELYIGFGVQSNGTFTKSSSTGSAADFYTAVTITGGTGQVFKNISGSYSLVYTGVAIAANDVFQFLVDMTNGTVDIKKNGSAYGTQITGLSTTINLFPFISMYGSISASANFGQQPFASTPTSGYLALNAYNI